MLCSPRSACRVRAFDLILNLGVHAHLLEPMMANDASTIEEDFSQEPFIEIEDQLATPGKRKTEPTRKLDPSSAIANFESWILNILYEILLFLVQVLTFLQLNRAKALLAIANTLACILRYKLTY